MSHLTLFDANVAFVACNVLTSSYSALFCEAAQLGPDPDGGERRCTNDTGGATGDRGEGGGLPGSGRYGGHGGEPVCDRTAGGIRGPLATDCKKTPAFQYANDAICGYCTDDELRYFLRAISFLSYSSWEFGTAVN